MENKLEIAMIVMLSVALILVGIFKGIDENELRRGKHHQKCYPNKTCNKDLTCIDDICVKEKP